MRELWPVGHLVARDTQFDPQVVETAVVVTEEVATMEATEALVEEEATLAVEVELAERVERVVVVTEVRRVVVAKQR